MQVALLWTRRCTICAGSQWPNGRGGLGILQGPGQLRAVVGNNDWTWHVPAKHHRQSLGSQSQMFSSVRSTHMRVPESSAAAGTMAYYLYL